VTRPRDPQDNATPSGTSLAIRVLARLALYQGDERYVRVATRAATSMASQHPLGFGHLLGSLPLLSGEAMEIALVGVPGRQDTARFLQAIQTRFLPYAVVPVGTPDSPAQEAIPLLAGRPLVGGKATAYLCRGFTCNAPITDPEALEEALKGG